mmetsp:Transcript_4251/g.8469  ORF Transcript_4251/g.8469 Transcript_4251/m.8469 type:complete len:170 (+) Transcript_4251:97-606(+)
MLVARAEIHYLQMNSKRFILLPICYPYTPWKLDANPRSLLSSPCTYEAMEKYIEDLNQALGRMRANIKVLYVSVYVTRTLVTVGLLIAGIVMATTKAFYIGIALLIVGTTMLFIGRSIQYCCIAQKSNTFRTVLAQFIARTRKSLLEQGVLVRPGYYGAYITFEPIQLG